MKEFSKYVGLDVHKEEIRWRWPRKGVSSRVIRARWSIAAGGQEAAEAVEPRRRADSVLLDKGIVIS